MNYSCTAYGFLLHLCFPCHALPESEPALTLLPDPMPDVRMVEGSVPYDLDGPVAEDVQWQAEAGRFLWRGGRRAGRFLVEGGCLVTLERSPAAEEEHLAFHFVRSVLPAVLRQRGLLVLHASTALTSSGAVAVCGRSGAGKSTTLAALMQRGCRMLADDITALCCTGQERGVQALPGLSQLYLCQDAMQGLQLDPAGLPFRTLGRLKLAVRPQTDMPTEPVPLRAIYLLDTHEGEDVRVHALRGVDRITALEECIYGPLLAEEPPTFCQNLLTVAKQTPIYRIERPVRRRTVEEIVEVMLRG